MKKSSILYFLPVLIIISCLVFTSCIKVTLREPEPEPAQLGTEPVINLFMAHPMNVTEGDSVELTWNVWGADTVYIDQGVGSVDKQGSITVNPVADITYVITATNGMGLVTDQVNISVEPYSPPLPAANLPVIEFFTAEPGLVYYGGSTTLSWRVSNATSIDISPSIGYVSGTDSITINPKGSVTFTLTAANSYGNTTATAQVIMTDSGTTTIYTGVPVINYFNADPLTVESGGYIVLNWSVSNAEAVIIFPDVGTVPASGSLQIAVQETTFFILQAANANGMVDESFTVTVDNDSPDFLALNWTGDYNTNWGTMHLEQTGNTVTGTYAYQEGRIEGTLSPDSQYVLLGRWMETPSFAPPSDAGDIYFAMDRHHSSFTGYWRYGYTGDYNITGDWDGSWTGDRISP
jgi:hypothetical protein